MIPLILFSQADKLLDYVAEGEIFATQMFQHCRLHLIACRHSGMEKALGGGFSCATKWCSKKHYSHGMVEKAPMIAFPQSCV